MPYYWKPEPQMEWVRMPIDVDVKDFNFVAPHSKLTPGHPVSRRLAEAGMGEGENNGRESAYG